MTRQGFCELLYKRLLSHQKLVVLVVEVVLVVKCKLKVSNVSVERQRGVPPEMTKFFSYKIAVTRPSRKYKERKIFRDSLIKG